MIILKPEQLAVPDNIVIGFSTRPGGVSPEPFDSLNMSLSRGDDPENVRANRSRFLSHFGLTDASVAQGKQISEDGMTRVDGPGVYPDCDALICTFPDVYLSVLTADCAPVLIWSNSKNIVASVHSGWQGSELNLLGKTIKSLVIQYNVPADTLFVAIGPGLTKDNFEVGPEFEQKFPRKYLQEYRGDRFMFDNNAYLRDSAVNQGVPENQVEILDYCSYEDQDLFFSHRRDKNITGRMMSIIGING